MEDKQERRLRDLAPRDELAFLLREAAASVEADFALEDEGWISLAGQTGDVISSSERIVNLKLSRLYAVKYPMGKQSIRLWTDYTFGTGMVWNTKDEKAKKVLEAFWGSKENESLLSARGQRKSSDKLLIDGEVFFALFLGMGGKETIRWIDPLEITEIITDSDDVEKVMYYKRVWTDSQNKSQEAHYRSTINMNGELAKDSQDKTVQVKDGPIVYLLTYNTTTQRGNPLLLPALIWMKYHHRQLASYLAVDLAQSKFVLRSKVKGGQAAVDAIKAKTQDKEINAGSTLLENMGVDTSAFKIDARAKNAYDGARLIKLQVCAAVGIPEQYFGDLATGNLATAKTVELPMIKMFQSYQRVWADTYLDIDQIVLQHNNLPVDTHIDFDFPPIAPRDVQLAAQALVSILQVMPNLADSPEVEQIALLTLGVNNPKEVLDALKKVAESNPEVAALKAIREIRRALIKKE